MIYGSLGYMLIEKARQTGDFAEAVEFNQKALETTRTTRWCWTTWAS